MKKINKFFGLITLVLLIVVSVEPVIAQSSRSYRIQVGAFRDPTNVVNVMNRLRSAGFNPASEPHGDLYRVFLPNLREANIHSVEQTLDRLGFRDRITRPEPHVAVHFPVQAHHLPHQAAIPSAIPSTIQPDLRIIPRSAYQTVPEDWLYIAQDAYSIAIKGYTGTATTVEIPNEIEGLIVTKINSRAFDNDKSLISVIIPNTVRRIEQAAFIGCSNLTSVTIGDDVEYIGEGAFAGCENLTSVTIPDRVTYIGGGAFKDCKKLISVTIGYRVDNIGVSAFEGCNDLINVTFKGIIPGNRFSLDSKIPGNLRAVYYTPNGGTGIYTRLSSAEVWWKQ